MKEQDIIKVNKIIKDLNVELATGKHLIMLIEPEVQTIGAGLIQVATTHVVKSTTGIIIIEASPVKLRNGMVIEPTFKLGQRVKIPSGNVGDTFDESPDGDEWVVISDDVIVYKTGDK